MKKVILLMIVLALVSTASATLSWSHTGNIVAGGNIVLTLSDTRTDVVSLTLAEFSDNGAGGTAGSTATLSSYFTQNLTTGYNGVDLGASAGSICIVTGAVNPPAYGTGALVSYTYTLPSTLPAGSITFSGIDHDGDWGYVGSVTYQGAAAAAIPSYVIQTPEPMTIALLGLGGLFLRRKLS